MCWKISFISDWNAEAFIVRQALLETRKDNGVRNAVLEVTTGILEYDDSIIIIPLLLV